MTHLLESYFVRMKFSIFLQLCQKWQFTVVYILTHVSDGMWPGASFASQYLY